MIDFAFRTGGDDLRGDSVVTAQLTFPDGSTQQCFLHGAHASGAAANLSWDDNSTHEAPPCRLRKPRTLGELRKSRMMIGLSAPGSGPNFGTMLASGGLAAMSVRSQDNWNIARVDVKAYNPDGSAETCVRSIGGEPVARLIGDQPVVTISDFPNQCR